MRLRPRDAEELQGSLAEATRARERMPIVDLGNLNRVLEHHPQDLTCSVECGCLLKDLQAVLALHRQWLPLDPPGADRLTLREVIELNLSGPSRLGFGTVRDHLVGLEVLLADGARIRSGGKVVKNVVGYDLHKLFIGSRGALGIPIVAHFKLRPLPAATAWFRVPTPSPEDASRVAFLAQSKLMPVALDITRPVATAPNCDVHLALAGDEAAVAAAGKLAVSLGFESSAVPDTELGLWEGPGLPASFSVLPSQLGGVLRRVDGRRFVARAGHGVVYHEGPPVQPRRRPPQPLLDRLKQTFDPHAILPPISE